MTRLVGPAFAAAIVAEVGWMALLAWMAWRVAA